jgi:hypothetical protein
MTGDRFEGGVESVAGVEPAHPGRRRRGRGGQGVQAASGGMAVHTVPRALSRNPARAGRVGPIPSAASNAACCATGKT